MAIEIHSTTRTVLLFKASTMFSARWQFSLRWLLAVAALAPLAVYWLSLPTIIARRYTAAVNGGNYRAADRLCLDPKQAFPGDWTRHKTFHPRAELSPLTWQDFRRGQRRILIGINYGDGRGLVGCGVECYGTARGIKVGMFMP
jgi:hypothetical protein